MPRSHFSNSCKTKLVLKMSTPNVSNANIKLFWKSQILEQHSNSNSAKTANLMFFCWHKWEDGSRKVSMNTVDSAQLPEACHFWCPKPFEMCFKPDPTRENPIIPDVAATTTADKLSNPDPGPSQLTHRWNTTARNPCCWRGLGTGYCVIYLRNRWRFYQSHGAEWLFRLVSLRLPRRNGI